MFQQGIHFPWLRHSLRKMASMAVWCLAVVLGLLWPDTTTAFVAEEVVVDDGFGFGGFGGAYPWGVYGGYGANPFVESVGWAGPFSAGYLDYARTPLLGQRFGPAGWSGWGYGGLGYGAGWGGWRGLGGLGWGGWGGLGYGAGWGGLGWGGWGGLGYGAGWGGLGYGGWGGVANYAGTSLPPRAPIHSLPKVTYAPEYSPRRLEYSMPYRTNFL